MIKEFLEAISIGDISKIKEFLAKGFDLNQPYSSEGMFFDESIFLKIIKDYAQLHSAELNIEFDPLEIIDVLLTEGNVDMGQIAMRSASIPDEYIIYVALFAFYQGYTQLTNDLIKRLDSINATDTHGNSIFDYINHSNSRGEFAESIDQDQVQYIENSILQNFLIKSIYLECPISTDITLYTEENFALWMQKFLMQNLMTSIENGDVESVQNILECGFDIHRIDTNISSEIPLVEAVFSNKMEIVKVLLNHGVSAHPSDNDNLNLLNHITINYQLFDRETIELMIKNRAELNPTEKQVSITPFWQVVIHGDMELIDYLVRMGAKIFPENLYNNSIMCTFAPHSKSLDIFNLIAEKSEGKIPEANFMHYVASLITVGNPNVSENNIFDMLKMIKDINYKDQYDNTIVTLIRRNWNATQKYVKFIVENLGYKITIIDLNCSYGEKYEYLKSICGEIDYNDVYDDKGNTNIMKLAQMQETLEVAKLLGQVDKKSLPIIDVNKTNKSGYKLIDFYSNIHNKNTNIINLLRKLGSAEPVNKIIPSSSKLNLSNVHDVQNKGAVNKIINMLHSKFSLDSAERDQMISDLIQRIKSMEPEIKGYYDMLYPRDPYSNSESKFGNILRQVQKLRDDSNKISEDGITWEFKDVIAHVYKYIVEVKLENFMGLVDSFSVEYSCDVGFLVKILMNAEEDNTKRFDYFSDLIHDHVVEGFDQVLSQVMQILRNRSIDTIETIQEFCNDICNKRGEIASYSKAASYVHGAFLEVLSNITSTQGVEIYSEDVEQWGVLERSIVSHYGEWILDQARDYNNEFYKLLGESCSGDSAGSGDM